MLNSIILLIPVMLLVTAFEWYVSVKQEKNIYTGENYAMNLAIGAMDQVFSLIYFTALYFTLDFVYRHFRFFTLESHWYHWVTAYVLIDFISYWYHRFSHRVNILWAGHVTHHSSEHYNFSNGFRTSFFQGINRIVFWSVLPLFGFTPLMLVIILKSSGLYDFLLHTTYIPKLGVLEKILITPSQHRVHHGRNDEYIDKNYGSTFVIWDKMFGTYQEETVPVEYGIKGDYVDNNPYHAIGYYYQYLWRVMKSTPGILPKLQLLVLPPDRTPKPEKRSWENRVIFLRHQSNLPVHSALRNYAWTQISWAASGLIVMLLFINFMPRWELVVYAFIGITTMAAAAMSLNGHFRESFSRSETMRLLMAMLLLVIAYGFKLKLYILAIALFPLGSLLYFLVLRDREHEVMS